MTMRTRYFVIASLLVLTVGLGTGLVAYYADTPAIAQAPQGTAAELAFVPANASLVAYAEVAEIMASPLRQKLRTLIPMRQDGQQEFQNLTGINIDTDIDRIVTAIMPAAGDEGPSGTPLVLARGRFDAVKIEALMREHGGEVETYKDQRIIVGHSHHEQSEMGVAFLEPGLAAVGTPALIRSAIDLQTGGSSILTNQDMMARMHGIEPGNAWAVGRFQDLAARVNLPSGMAQSLPALTWITASARIDSGVTGLVKAEARDEEAANGLRDVVRGIMAFGKLQSNTHPEIQTLLQSVELGGSGNTVAISFNLPAELVETLGTLAKSAPRGHRPVR